MTIRTKPIAKREPRTAHERVYGSIRLWKQTGKVSNDRWHASFRTCHWQQILVANSVHNLHLDTWCCVCPFFRTTAAICRENFPIITVPLHCSFSRWADERTNGKRMTLMSRKTGDARCQPFSLPMGRPTRLNGSACQFSAPSASLSLSRSLGKEKKHFTTRKENNELIFSPSSSTHTHTRSRSANRSSPFCHQREELQHVIQWYISLQTDINISMLIE